MKTKRGETESYSFLIGIIITFLLLSAVGCVVYQIYSKGTETEESFKKLAETIKNLKDGEQGKMPLYVDKDYIMVGFGIDQKTVESKAVIGKDILLSYCYSWYTAGFDGLQIERPPQCKGKGCICLCKYKNNIAKQIGAYEKWARFGGIYITKDVCSDPDDKCITEGIGQYNFVGEKGCKIAFIPGLKYKWSITMLTGQPIEAYERGVESVNYKRKGNTIVIDDEQISKEEIQKEISNLNSDSKSNINQ
ncbi:MAG: hypothetical protein QW404_00105 [Candidatus Nanoarchaeia archaeon]